MSEIKPINTSYCLEQLCESNFHKLLRLIPDLISFKTSAIGRTKIKPDLFLEIINRSHYTMTIELSHCFHGETADSLAPAVRIRIYLDVEMVEVLRDHVRGDVFRVYRSPSKTLEILEYKWKLNYFLQKWLDHCLLTEYTFSSDNQKKAGCM